MWLTQPPKIVVKLSENVLYILDEWNGYLESFSFSQVLEFLGNICSFEQLFYRKKSLGVPD